MARPLKLVDKTVFPMVGTEGRFKHFATIEDAEGNRYMAFGDYVDKKMYIEAFKEKLDNVRGAQKVELATIPDNELFTDLLEFVKGQGCIPTFPGA